MEPRLYKFAKKYDLLEVMPAMCNPDFTGMELIHAKLIRKTTCSNGCRCDYTICGDQNPCAMEHPEYQDEQGYRRNR
ncbi:L-2-amino-thiazoline-4-carboxylic acid hydrolase [[Ruminococcus] lactaris]